LKEGEWHFSALSDGEDILTDPQSACATTPECAQRLVLRECLERWRTEAQHGVFDNGRYRCPYVAWGDGPPLVLIPGMGLDALGFVMLVTRLKSHFRCISYDLPTGDSDGARILTYTHEDHVADLFALLDHLAIRQCSLFGASFGSTITLAAMHQQPLRFPRAILQGGFACRRIAPAEVLAASFARYLPGRLSWLPLITPILERAHRDSFQMRDADVWDFFVKESLRAPLRAFAVRALLIHRLDLRPILSTITQPVLMVCGDRDHLVSKACEAELRAGLPSVARAEIEQCGHMPQLSHPEVLAEVVRQYLLPESSDACPMSHGG
jgi:pimeloyl-ACP methyl ester carboxylesterase